MYGIRVLYTWILKMNTKSKHKLHSTYLLTESVFICMIVSYGALCLFVIDVS